LRGEVSYRQSYQDGEEILLRTKTGLESGLLKVYITHSANNNIEKNRTELELKP